MSLSCCTRNSARFAENAGETVTQHRLRSSRPAIGSEPRRPTLICQSTVIYQEPAPPIQFRRRNRKWNRRCSTILARTSPPNAIRDSPNADGRKRLISGQSCRGDQPSDGLQCGR